MVRASFAEGSNGQKQGVLRHTLYGDDLRAQRLMEGRRGFDDLLYTARIVEACPEKEQ